MARGPIPQLSQGWFIKDTAIRQAGWRRCNREELEPSCLECRGATTYRTFEEAASHLQRQHFRIPGLPLTKANLRAFCHQYQPNTFNGWLESQWRDGLASLIVSLSDRTPSIRRVYHWKLGLLAHSDHFLTMLWYGAVFGNHKNVLLFSMDGAGKFLTILKDAFTWDGLVQSKLDDSIQMDVDDEGESSSWTRSDGAVDFNMSDTVPREERPFALPIASFLGWNAIASA